MFSPPAFSSKNGRLPTLAVAAASRASCMAITSLSFVPETQNCLILILKSIPGVMSSEAIIFTLGKKKETKDGLKKRDVAEILTQEAAGTALALLRTIRPAALCHQLSRSLSLQRGFEVKLHEEREGPQGRIFCDPRGLISQ